MTLPPIISPLFRVEDDVLEYKPYPSYPAWLTAWDVSGFTGDASAALAAAAAAQATADTALANAAHAESAADDAQATADLAEIHAQTGITNAAAALSAANEADDTADAAQATANTALTNAATALTAANEADDTADAAQATADALLASLPKSAEMFSDIAVVTVGTPTLSENTIYRYNFIRFTTVVNAVFTWNFVADMRITGSISVLFAQGSGACVCELFVDGISLGTRDMSTGGSNNRQTWVVTYSSAVFGNFRHELKLKAISAGSVGAAFGLSITKVWVNAG